MSSKRYPEEFRIEVIQSRISFDLMACENASDFNACMGKYLPRRSM